jgi:hypothetical protein
MIRSVKKQINKQTGEGKEALRGRYFDVSSIFFGFLASILLP